MRFGIFWRSLRFKSLTKSNDVVRAAALLHNFIIDSREDAHDYYYFKNLSHEDVAVAEASMTPTGVGDIDDDEFTYPLVVDNNEPKPSGRPTNETVDREREGNVLRDELCVTLYSEGLHRRLHPTRMRYNCLGHVYCI